MVLVYQKYCRKSTVFKWQGRKWEINQKDDLRHWVHICLRYRIEDGIV